MQRWHDFPGEQPHRNSGLLEAHGTEDHMARNIIHSGFAREFLKVVKHRLGRTGDAMTDRGELVKTPRVSRRERKIDSRSLKKKFQRLASRPIGLVRDASRLSVCFRNHNVPRYADHRQITAVAAQGTASAFGAPYQSGGCGRWTGFATVT